MLIVLGGLPGTGKSTIARELVARWPAAYLRIDTIEQALMAVQGDEVGPAGYAVAYALARSNLALGLAVVADGVNPLPVTREAWRAVATSTGSALLEVEIVCADPVVHRARVERRQADDPAWKLPTWHDVLRHEYEPWTTRRLAIDSAALSASAAAEVILQNACATASASGSRCGPTSR